MNNSITKQIEYNVIHIQFVYLSNIIMYSFVIDWSFESNVYWIIRWTDNELFNNYLFNCYPNHHPALSLSSRHHDHHHHLRPYFPKPSSTLGLSPTSSLNDDPRPYPKSNDQLLKITKYCDHHHLRHPFPSPPPSSSIFYVSSVTFITFILITFFLSIQKSKKFIKKKILK